MSRPRRIALAVALAALHVARAAADPETDTVHVQSSSHLVSTGGSELDLPPGYFVPEEKWDALDLEVKRLQDRETQLDAENRSLRDSASAWPGWQVTLAAVLVGVAGGAYAAHRWW